MSKDYGQPVEYFDAGVKTIIEVNEAPVEPETPSRGGVTVAMFGALFVAIILFFAGVFYGNGFHLLSACFTAIFAICALTLLRDGRHQLREIEQKRAEMVQRERQQYCPKDRPEAHYIVRYLEHKQAGLGEIVHTFSATTMTLTDARGQWPDVFSQPGTYSLMRATGEVLNIDKGKNNAT